MGLLKEASGASSCGAAPASGAAPAPGSDNSDPLGVVARRQHTVGMVRPVRAKPVSPLAKPAKHRIPWDTPASGAPGQQWIGGLVPQALPLAQRRSNSRDRGRARDRYPVEDRATRIRQMQSRAEAQAIVHVYGARIQCFPAPDIARCIGGQASIAKKFSMSAAHKAALRDLREIGMPVSTAEIVLLRKNREVAKLAQAAAASHDVSSMSSEQSGLIGIDRSHRDASTGTDATGGERGRDSAAQHAQPARAGRRDKTLLQQIIPIGHGRPSQSSGGSRVPGRRNMGASGSSSSRSRSSGSSGSSSRRHRARPPRIIARNRTGTDITRRGRGDAPPVRASTLTAGATKRQTGSLAI